MGILQFGLAAECEVLRNAANMQHCLQDQSSLQCSEFPLRYWMYVYEIDGSIGERLGS